MLIFLDLSPVALIVSLFDLYQAI